MRRRAAAVLALARCRRWPARRAAGAARPRAGLPARPRRAPRRAHRVVVRHRLAGRARRDRAARSASRSPSSARAPTWPADAPEPLRRAPAAVRPRRADRPRRHAACATTSASRAPASASPRRPRTTPACALRDWTLRAQRPGRRRSRLPHAPGQRQRPASRSTSSSPPRSRCCCRATPASRARGRGPSRPATTTASRSSPCSGTLTRDGRAAAGAGPRLARPRVERGAARPAGRRLGLDRHEPATTAARSPPSACAAPTAASLWAGGSLRARRRRGAQPSRPTRCASRPARAGPARPRAPATRWSGASTRRPARYRVRALLDAQELDSRASTGADLLGRPVRAARRARPARRPRLPRDDRLRGAAAPMHAPSLPFIKTPLAVRARTLAADSIHGDERMAPAPVHRLHRGRRRPRARHRAPATSCSAFRWRVGKPNPFVNALYRRIKANPARRLRIVTALSLEKPVGKSELERHFLEPLVERVFGDYPDLDYVKDLRAGTLPPNIEVREFFMKTGDYLGNPAAQQNYISTNYTFVARDMAVQGMNVIAQAVAARGEGDELRLSLSSNPDVMLEVVEKLRRRRPAAADGRRDQPARCPSCPTAPRWRPASSTSSSPTRPARTRCSAPPNNKVSAADYAIGLHASSLVADGGTLQIGIGSLGDAIAQALIVRDRHGDEYRRILESLCPDGLAGRELGRFDQGLYGCSEMFVNGFLKLIEAGIIRREVFGDAVLQQLLNDGAIDEAVTPETLRALLRHGAHPLAAGRRRTSPSCSTGACCAPRCGIDGDTLVLRRHAAAQRPDRRRQPSSASARRMLGTPARARHLHDRRLLPRPARLLRAAAHDAAAGAGEDRHDAHRLHQPALRRRGRPEARAAAQGALHEHDDDRHAARRRRAATRSSRARWSAASAGSTTSSPWRMRCPTRGC